MWYTIFDIHQPEHYIWAKNITSDNLYSLLSKPHAFYGYIGISYILGGSKVMYDRMTPIKSNGNEWKSTYTYYTISEFIKVYKMDMRRIHLFYIDPADQTDEICLAAVKRDPSNLYHVVHQTDEVCREALRRDGKHLCKVKNKTEEFILLAIETEALWALHYTPKSLQTRKICFEAAKKDINAINEIKCRDLRREIATLFRRVIENEKEPCVSIDKSYHTP